MAFTQNPLPMAVSGMARNCMSFCKRIVLLLTRLLLSLAMLAVIAVGLLYLRLMQGPLELPLLGQWASERLNAATDGYGVEIGGLLVDLEAGDGLSAVQLTEMTIKDPDGSGLFSLPRVAATLGLSDLLHGRVSPEKITIKAPDVTFTRTVDGRLHLRVGNGQGISLAAGQAELVDGVTEGNVLETVLAQLVGDQPAMGSLEALRSVRIDGAMLTYEDNVLDAAWQSRGAKLELVRFEGGARAVVQADVIDVPGQSSAVRLVAERYKGQQDLRLIASFGEINPAIVAAQMPGLAWLSVLEGSIEGRATATVDPTGQVTALAGTIVSEQGQMKGWGEDGQFETAQVRFEMDPEQDLIMLEQAILSSRALDTAMRGTAQIRRDAEGNMSGLAGQLSLDRIYAKLPDLFSDPIAFSDGQINFRWGFDNNVIEIADSSLESDGLVFQLDARAVESEEGWITDLRAEAHGMDIKGLLAHWPLATAKNARDWVAEHISKANVPEFLAQIRIGTGEPQLALDFRFEDLTSSYLDNMSPIQNADGRGTMSYHDLHLEFDKAQVTPKGHKPIALGGSIVAIRDFRGEETPADIRLVATGETKAILALIDQKPLSLVSKLGIDLGQPAGTAEVITVVEFPLIADLLLEQINADAKATFRKFALDLALGEKDPIRITGDRLKLAADTKALQLSGKVAFDGIPAQIDWKERYGGRNQGRTIALQGRTSPKLLAMLGAGELPIDGQAPFKLDLAQGVGADASFDLDIDLTPVALEIAEIDWRKRQGTVGRLIAKGTVGDAVSVELFDFRAAGLVAEGSLEIGTSGGIDRARLDRLVVPGLADVRGQVSTGSDGVLEVRLTGGEVDLSGQLEGDDADADSSQAGDPIRLSFDLDSLLLTETIMLQAASGEVTRTAAGALGAEITGDLAGQAALAVQLNRPPEGGGRVTLSSPDAGRALEAADLYRGAKGGKLLVEARIGRGDGPDLQGSARIDDITVRSESTFSTVLRQGGLDDAQQQVTRSGLGFRKIWIPFVYDDGILTLSDAIATSPVLALKVSGTLDEETEALDLSGVLSPAYALTGALNEIPVLGKILSGGEGEGILAMTFTLRGPARDPDLSVNPLSLLAPGFLRSIFSGGNRPPAANFQSRIIAGQDK
ncbi:MAG: AsmA-like C-terminal region-containing protein [Paracoccaceae bacterium]